MHVIFLGEIAKRTWWSGKGSDLRGCWWSAQWFVKQPVGSGVACHSVSSFLACTERKAQCGYKAVVSAGGRL